MFIDILILYHINLSSNIFMNFLKNKTILINGGTGSFGSNFVKELLKNKYDIKKIIIFILDELKQFELQKKFQNNVKKLRFLLGDIRDNERPLYAFKNVKVESFKQLPILWSDNFLIKYLFGFFSELTRILVPEYFRQKFKWIRFSKEIMLLSFGTK
jgi:hypothetical protein